MDCRAAGKGYEEFVRYVIEQDGVRYVRGRPAKVLPMDGRLLVRAEDTLIGVPIEDEADMVVLAPATVARPETVELAGMLKASTDEYGFLESEPGTSLQEFSRSFFCGWLRVRGKYRGVLDAGRRGSCRSHLFFQRADNDIQA